MICPVLHTHSEIVLQGRADTLAMELEASRAQAAQADAEAAETEAAFRLLQAEVGFFHQPDWSYVEADQCHSAEDASIQSAGGAA